MLPGVTPTEALTDIRGYAVANRIRLTALEQGVVIITVF
jgi:hypothetical protein